MHEHGHIMVGLMNGCKFYLLTVGSIGLKTYGQGKVVLNYEKNILLRGGVGATLPKKKESVTLTFGKKF